MWRSGVAGMMLFEPPSTDLNEARAAMSRLSVHGEPKELAGKKPCEYSDGVLEVKTYDSQGVRNEDDDREVLPSTFHCEVKTISCVESELRDQEHPSYSTSPSTLSASSECVFTTPPDTTSKDSMTLPCWEELFHEQITLFAANAPSSVSTTPESTANSCIPSGYETDRTDYLPYAETPCPPRAQELHRNTELSSRFFVKDTRPERNLTPISRRLWGNAANKKQAKYRTPQKKTENDKLRDIERRSPPHKW
jgi:hypothetical protein